MKIILIVTTGRTGSDYLHHCLEGLKGLIVFSDKFDYQQFFKDRNHLRDPNKLLMSFLKKYSYLFSQIEIENIKINLSIGKFKKNFNKLSGTKKINQREFLVLLYKSYHLTAGRKLKNAKAIIHHSHGLIETKKVLKDFPKAKILVTIRNPLSNLRAGLINWFKYDKSRINMKHVFDYIYRIRQDLKFLIKLKNKKMFVKLEEANSRRIKKKICNFLSIKFQNNIFKATTLGIPWIGDKLSPRLAKKGQYLKPEGEEEYSKFYTSKEIKLLSFIFRDYNIFGYKLKSFEYLNELIFFLNIPFLLSFEKDVFSYKHKKSLLLLNIKYYIYRLVFFLVIFFKLEFLIKNKHTS
tara:strand:- start:219 stop:1271 length:1053 start_codon:yes stop_codon:yes gene_type:complete